MRSFFSRMFCQKPVTFLEPGNRAPAPTTAMGVKGASVDIGCVLLERGS